MQRSNYEEITSLVYNSAMDHTIRLDSLLSDQGFCARRKVQLFLSHNQVLLNNMKISEPGTRVNLSTDKISVNGKELNLEPDKELIYLVLNKQKGVLSAASDNPKRRTVLNYVPSKYSRVFPVGRLDEQSTGLVLLTNDGDLSYKLSHPMFNIPKKYLVWVVGSPSEKRLIPLREGVRLKEGKTPPANVTILKTSPKRTLIEIVINEGKNHQIRRMFERVHLPITDLKRVSMGSLNLNYLGLGKLRELEESEIKALKSEVEAKVKEITQK